MECSTCDPAPLAGAVHRLLEHLMNNRSSFESTGFTWTGDQAAIKSKDIEVPPWLKPDADKAEKAPK